MEHSDSIIVYRSPLEKMFWEGEWVELAQFVIPFLLSAFVVFWISYLILTLVKCKSEDKKAQSIIWAIVGGFIFCVGRFVLS